MDMGPGNGDLYQWGVVFCTFYLRDCHYPPGMVEASTGTGLWAFIRALEIPTTTPGAIGRTALTVPGAAHWVIIVGGKVYQFCKENRLSTGEPQYPDFIGWPDVHGFLWESQNGYNLERWSFWKRRFGEIANLDSAKE